MKHKILLVLVSLVLLVGMLGIPVQAADPEDIENSIVKGLEWLVAQQDPVSGSWGSGYVMVSETAFAVVKLEDRAFELHYSGPFDPDYPYKENVEKGLDYLFDNAATVGIADQPAGDPDTNNNDIGVKFGSQETYDTGIAMMAIAASRAPDHVVNVSGSAVDGWTYKAVLQDAVDYFAWGQTDAGSSYQGGWYYGPNEGWSDNSNAGYAVLGLRYAEAAPYGFACTIPDFVKTELDVWIDYIQSADGGSGYTAPNNWENVLKTGNLLFQMSFFGDDTSVPRAQSAIDYIGVHWYDTDLSQGWGWNQPSGPTVAQYQAAYCLMKGLESMGIPMDGIPGVTDWFQDLADVIVPQQDAADGSWPESYAYVWEGGGGGHLVDRILSTEWALLTLEKVGPPPPVNVEIDAPACACDVDGYDVTVTYTVERIPSTGTVEVYKDSVLHDTIILIGFSGTESKLYNIPSDMPGMHTWEAVIDVTSGAGAQAHDEDDAIINVCETPEVLDIPDQTAPFEAFDLDGYLSYSGALSVSWSVSGVPVDWTVEIDAENVVTVTAPDGAPATLTFTASVTCCDGVVCSDSDDAVFIPNQPPDCSNAYAEPSCLWPPNHKFVDISIMGVTDPDGDPVIITITAITSDEPTASDLGSGGEKHAPDASGIGTDTASVRAERSGTSDGRVYMIWFTASDGRGGECEGSVMVKVPHDQSSEDCTAIDSGQDYDATQIN